VPRRIGWAKAVLALLSTCVLAACTDSPGEQATGTRPVARDGGSIVVGAEQEPDCVDWIATCAGSIWGTYVMQVTTIPRAFDTRLVADTWAPVPSDLLAGEPTVTVNGNTQTITYRINPKAVWSDGVAITSEDFAYTAGQIRDGDDIFDKSGYDQIVSVQTPDPRTAVVTLKTPYARWRTLFSEAGVLPSHVLAGKDRAAIMKDGYDFSGGPWKIQSWDRGTSATLVPNDKYWGEKPHLDKVTFLFLPDTAAAFQALKGGQVDVLYPSPQLDAINQIKAGLQGISSEIDPRSGNLEAVWLNNAAFPFTSLAVRRAVAFSLDRDAIVKRMFGGLGIGAVQQSFNTPIVGEFAGDSFSRYHRDPTQVSALMTADGWRRNAGGTWEKDGKPAAFEMVSLSGNKRRDLTAQGIQSQLREAGFDMSIKTVTAADLFSTIAPEGDFQAGLWAIVDTFPDPTLSASFSSSSIPAEANGFSGINFFHVDRPDLDTLLGRVDTEIDHRARVAASKQADSLIASQVLSIPLDVVPNVLLWDRKVGGPLSINPVLGPFWNLADWGLAG
jgi:peptide/nickel transport system substrate-binding protein